jgi:transcriptional regulator GlxA family with amidase domain
VHDGRPLGGPLRTWRTVYLEPDLMEALGAPRDTAINRPAFVDAELAHAVRRLLATMAAWTGGQRDALACEQALVGATGLLLERHVTQRKAQHAPPAALAAVRDRLADEMLDPPSLAELAAQAGLGRFQLLRRFAARQWGYTPGAWQRASLP